MAVRRRAWRRPGRAARIFCARRARRTLSFTSAKAAGFAGAGEAELALVGLHGRVAQRPAPFCRCLDGIHERGAQAPGLERVQAGDGGSSGRGDHVLQAPRVLVRLDEELGRAEKRLGGQGLRVVPPMIQEIDWSSFGITFGIIGAVFAVVIAILLLSVFRMSIHSVLRMGER